MKVSLRKANVIQKSIQEEINNLDLATDVSISEFEKPSSKLEEMQGRFFTNMETRSKLLDALYEIRAAVSGVNASSGINGLLSILAHNEKEIGMYVKLAKLTPQVDIDIIRGKIEKIKARKEDSYYGNGSDTVTTSIFDAESIRGFKNKLATLKKEKQKLQDELLELNVRSEIMLSAKAVEILEEVRIL